jgi:hypothetical protein
MHTVALAKRLKHQHREQRTSSRSGIVRDVMSDAITAALDEAAALGSKLLSLELLLSLRVPITGPELFCKAVRNSSTRARKTHNGKRVS